MMFNLFSGGTKEKPEYVSDETLMEAMKLIVDALELQISSAKEMSHTIPDGETRFDALLDGSFFYGYLVGLSDRIAAEQFGELIDKQNLGKNIRRLIQGVVANLFYPDTQPDWDAVLKWEAQATAYGTSRNSSYEEGMSMGTLLGEEILFGSNGISLTSLGTELLKPL